MNVAQPRTSSQTRLGCSPEQAPYRSTICDTEGAVTPEVLQLIVRTLGSPVEELPLR
jgi:hypothetical protein